MIDMVEVAPHRLVVRWSDGTVSEYPWLWLRDHAHDEATIHPVTRQRQLHTASIDPGLRGVAATVIGAGGGASIEVAWADGTASRLPVEFLAAHSVARPVRVELPAERMLWDAETIAEQWPTVVYDDVMASDEAVATWLDHIATYGFCITTGTPTTIEATEALVRRIGYVRETIFGRMWDFQPDLKMADTAYTTVELLPHTDGTYSHDAPGLQVLHCLAFDGTGGESTMVDGFRIAAELSATAPELYDALSRVDVPGQYLGDGSHLLAARPVFRHDRSGELVQVSFNNADRAPFLLPPDEMERFYEALRAFDALANDRRLQWRRVNPPGDTMVFDNWRVLHGRAAFTGRRHMCGAYVNREDYESRRRTLADPAVGGFGS